MDTSFFIYASLSAIALGAALVLAGRLIVWLKLRRLRFVPTTLERSDRQTMPAAERALLDPVADRLAALGFVFEETLSSPAMLIGDPRTLWIDGYVNAAKSCRAYAQLAELPEPGALATITFVTDFAQTAVVTENRRQHLLFPMPPQYRVADALADSLEAHWAFHCQRVDETTTAGGLIFDRDAIAQRRSALRAGLFDFWQQSGLLACVDSSWQLTRRGAWQSLRRMLAGTRRIARLPALPADEPIPLRADADRQAALRQETIDTHYAMPLRQRALWFALSTGVGLLAFGAFISWRMAPAIMFILLFHELGHALAMRVVGYQRLNVLVIPLLGAVAIGRKDDASPWQKLGVLLAGPLPGLLIGGLLLRYALNGGGVAGWLTDIAASALVINLFNLLPFTPLDGGQIVGLFLFSRHPRLHLGFFVASVAALIGVAIHLDSIPLLAGAAVLLATLPGAWQRTRLLQALRTSSVIDEDEHRVFAAIHTTAGRRVPAFARRLQTARAVLAWVRGRMPNAWESLAGMAIYLLVVMTPIAALWTTGWPQMTLAALSASRATAQTTPPPTPDWSERLAKATTPESRWQVLWEAGQWAEDAEEETQARDYYTQALALAQTLPDSPIRHLHTIDARLALTRFAERAVAQAEINDLLPHLRELAPAERFRLADALESLQWIDARADDATRTARYREAVTARELNEGTNRFSLLEDRLQLARLLDAQGHSDEAETLLRRNFKTTAKNAGMEARWSYEPFVWFLIAHGRSAETADLNPPSPESRTTDWQLISTRAWSAFMRGERADATRELEDALPPLTSEHWQMAQRIDLLLDLIHFTAAQPEQQQRWIDKASKTAASMKDRWAVNVRRIAYNASPPYWDAIRTKARIEAIRRLPGGSDALQSAQNTNTCRRPPETPQPTI